MATVKVIQVKSNLRAAIRYGVNGAKTGMGQWVSNGVGVFHFEYLVDVAVDRFMYTQNAANGRYVSRDRLATPKRRGRRPKVLAHHIIQSFKPGETTAAEAHQVGVEFIKKIAGGYEHEWVIATHIDKHHIHNHIYLNPVNNKTLERMQVKPWTLKQWRTVSDELCRARGLSVIETEQSRSPRRRQIHEIYASLGGGYEKKWLAGIIDEAVARAKNWSEFTALLKEYKIGISMRGANVVFHLPREGGRPVRGASLGAPYTQHALINRLSTHVTPTFIATESLVGRKDKYGTRKVRIPNGHTVFGREVYMKMRDTQLIPRGTSFIGIAPEGTLIDLCDKQGNYVATIPSSELFKFFSGRQPHLGVSRPAIRPRGKTIEQQRHFAKIDRQADAIRVKHSVEATEIRRRWSGMSDVRKALYAREIVARIDTESAKLDELIVKRERLSQEIDGARLPAPFKRIELGRLDEAIARQELLVRSIHAGWIDTAGKDPQFQYMTIQDTKPVVTVPLHTVSASAMSDEEIYRNWENNTERESTHRKLGMDIVTYKHLRQSFIDLKTGEQPPYGTRTGARDATDYEHNRRMNRGTDHTEERKGPRR